MTILWIRSFLGLLFAACLPATASSLRSVEAALYSGRSAIQYKIDCIYQDRYALPLSEQNTHCLWLLHRTPDNVAAPNSAAATLTNIRAFLAFWAANAEEPPFWLWTPHWDAMARAIGVWGKTSASASLSQAIMDLSAAPKTNAEDFAALLGSPLDHPDEGSTFFSNLNRCLAPLVRNPLRVILGNRISITKNYNIGLFGRADDLTRKLYALSEHNSTKSDVTPPFPEHFSALFGSFKNAAYCYPCTFAQLLYSIGEETDRLFPALWPEVFEALATQFNANYILSGSAPRGSIAADLDAWEEALDDPARWPELDCIAETEFNGAPEMLAELLVARRQLARPLLTTLGGPEDTHTRETAFGLISFLENKIGQYMPTALQERIQSLRLRLEHFLDSVQQALQHPVVFSISQLYNAIAFGFEGRIADAIGNIQTVADLEKLNSAWADTYIGRPDDPYTACTMHGAVSRAMQELFAMPALAGFGELPSVSTLASHEPHAFCSYLHTIIQTVRQTEQAKHNPTANFLLANVFGAGPRAGQQSIQVQVNLLSALLRATYRHWEFSDFEYLLHALAHSPERNRSLSDLIEHVASALPTDPAEEDLTDLKEIFPLINTVLPSATTTDWGELVPFLNQVLVRLFPWFLQEAIGDPGTEASFADDRPIFAWIAALKDDSLTHKAWGAALPPTAHAILEDFEVQLEKVLYMLSSADTALLSCGLADACRFIGSPSFPSQNSLRHLMQNFCMRLHSPGDASAERLLSEICERTREFYGSLCCPCIRVDAALSVLGSCVEDIANTLSGTSKMRLDAPLSSEMQLHMKGFVGGLNSLFDSIHSAFIAVHRTCASGDFVDALEEATQHACGLVDAVRTMCLSPAPTRHGQPMPIGNGCEHISESLQTIVCALGKLHAVLASKLVRSTLQLGLDPALLAVMHSQLASTRLRMQDFLLLTQQNPNGLPQLCQTCADHEIAMAKLESAVCAIQRVLRLFSIASD